MYLFFLGLGEQVFGLFSGGGSLSEDFRSDQGAVAIELLEAGGVEAGLLEHLDLADEDVLEGVELEAALADVLLDLLLEPKGIRPGPTARAAGS
jgi:hypothetical protein